MNCNELIRISQNADDGHFVCCGDVNFTILTSGLEFIVCFCQLPKLTVSLKFAVGTTAILVSMDFRIRIIFVRHYGDVFFTNLSYYSIKHSFSNIWQ